MKKLLIITMAISLVVGTMSGCSGGTSTPAPTTAASAPTTAASTDSASAKPEETNAAADAFADGPSYKLKIAHVQGTSHPYQIGAQYIADQLKERSNGKITAEVYPSSQLGGERDTTEGAQMGTVDIVITGTAVLANFDKSYTVFDFPFLFENREHAFAALDGDFGKQKLESLEQYGLIGLCFFENGFFNIMNTKKDITVIEDMKGLNIRTMENAVYMAAFSALGANPVPMAANEVYTSLQNGTVDGCCLSINGIYALAWYEPQKSYMLSDMFFCATPVIMSKTVYDSMPSEYQELIREVAADAAEVERQNSQDQEATNLQAMIDYGINTTTPENRDDWVNLMKEEVYPQFTDLVPQSLLDEIERYK